VHENGEEKQRRVFVLQVAVFKLDVSKLRDERYDAADGLDEVSRQVVVPEGEDVAPDEFAQLDRCCDKVIANDVECLLYVVHIRIELLLLVLNQKLLDNLALDKSHIVLELLAQDLVRHLPLDVCVRVGEKRLIVKGVQLAKFVLRGYFQRVGTFLLFDFL
jgi:hypothetical protein